MAFPTGIERAPLFPYNRINNENAQIFGGEHMKRTIASLEGLRGCAALLVVVYHMQFYLPGRGASRNGYLAVDLFFVLSGFVICSAYGNRIGDTRQWLSFMVRRFGRLWPTHMVASVLYYVMLNLLVAMAVVLRIPNAHPFVPTVTEAGSIATMTQGLHLFQYDIGNGVSWSTADEFYIYILFGALCLLMPARHRAAGFATLAILGYAIAVWASLIPRSCMTRGDCLGATFDWGWARCMAGFFIGATIAHYRDHRIVTSTTGAATQISITAIVIALILFADCIPGLALVAPSVFALLIASLSRDEGPIARLLHCRATQYLGSVSYSLYLGHAVFRPALLVSEKFTTGPVALAIEYTVFLAASFVLANRLNRSVETPFRERFNAWADTAFRSSALSRPAVD
ncbi:acyltransferase family protein [Burkholderia anthina]|uniref:acyltransferase family protein n=1 Tax=Burkholderia anthina TaxID=179879 RepID=UPI001FC81D71|nr:acyltransferase [Burkholderia anthina]